MQLIYNIGLHVNLAQIIQKKIRFHVHSIYLFMLYLKCQMFVPLKRKINVTLKGSVPQIIYLVYI